MLSLKKTIFCVALSLLMPLALLSEEIRLFDNSYIFGSVASFKDGKLDVRLSNGEAKIVPLEDVIIVKFLGRIPLSLQSGTQEFRFIDGSRIRAMIDKNDKDILYLRSATAGNFKLNLDRLKGFVSMPIEGFVGGKADDMVDSKAFKSGSYLDYVLTQNTTLDAGLLFKFERTNIQFDSEEFFQTVPLKISFLAGLRMADKGRVPREKWDGSAQVRLWTRDGSIIMGKVLNIEFGRWKFAPNWDKSVTLNIPIDEIVQAEVMGGQVQYLSQLEPSKEEENTIVAPQQPYRMDKNCQGGSLTIGSKRYPWGIGVHSNSSLEFELHKKFKKFKSEVGIDSVSGTRGSVVFEVLGDGNSLYKSSLIKGGMKPVEIDVSVEGVSVLTLKVTDGGDLDVGDIANWVSARVEK